MTYRTATQSNEASVAKQLSNLGVSKATGSQATIQFLAGIGDDKVELNAAEYDAAIAFFQERDRFWSIAEPPTMNRKSLIETFNIQYYPTRILVDAEGRIIRKFIGEELDDFIPYLTPHLTSN